MYHVKHSKFVPYGTVLGNNSEYLGNLLLIFVKMMTMKWIAS